MRSTDKNRDKDVGKFFVHTMQLLPKSSCRKLETMKILSVNYESETTLAFNCQVSKLNVHFCKMLSVGEPVGSISFLCIKFQNETRMS